MSYEKVEKTFRMVGLKGEGTFADFGTEVPKLAGQLLEKLHEVNAVTGPEIALYEPKRDENHLKGIYYVGITVEEPLTDLPEEMTYLELKEDYATTKGDVHHVGDLHSHLVKWIDEKGYQRKADAYIVETYRPTEDDGEEVVVYLPLQP
ncbi:AraC family transcriptional regulator [Bacillus sp. AFS015802]|uniref:GyrI-like domain-containing protein n=1 Tax=Bacillus sp. AFS015802 TaxID=2033486 RepID=UPI000BF4FF4B|nr:GyrI-like domain-containing protein [Bacillus sp. AFS015802]PFA63044.1 AraC family transcriptional regulator [Bacillus sp. AFS015802]